MMKRQRSCYVDIEASCSSDDGDEESSENDDECETEDEEVEEEEDVPMYEDAPMPKRLRDDSELEELIRKVVREEVQKIADINTTKLAEMIVKMGCGLKNVILKQEQEKQ